MAMAEPAVRFVCDPSLGGLARWLRAAGYEARWRLEATREQLLPEAAESGAIFLTSEHEILERRRVRRDDPRTLLVPTSLRRGEQLALVLQTLELPLLAPRCMRCGGALRVVEKAAVRERIPPRTAGWLDAYFVCEECDQLFWEGTHWQRIRERLRRAAES